MKLKLVATVKRYPKTRGQKWKLTARLRSNHYEANLTWAFIQKAIKQLTPYLQNSAMKSVFEKIKGAIKDTLGEHQSVKNYLKNPSSSTTITAIMNDKTISNEDIEAAFEKIKKFFNPLFDKLTGLISKNKTSSFQKHASILTKMRKFLLQTSGGLAVKRTIFTAILLMTAISFGQGVSQNLDQSSGEKPIPITTNIDDLEKPDQKDSEPTATPNDSEDPDPDTDPKLEPIISKEGLNEVAGGLNNLLSAIFENLDFSGDDIDDSNAVAADAYKLQAKLDKLGLGVVTGVATAGGSTAAEAIAEATKDSQKSVFDYFVILVNSSWNSTDYFEDSRSQQTVNNKVTNETDNQTGVERTEIRDKITTFTHKEGVETTNVQVIKTIGDDGQDKYYAIAVSISTHAPDGDMSKWADFLKENGVPTVFETVMKYSQILIADMGKVVKNIEALTEHVYLNGKLIQVEGALSNEVTGEKIEVNEYNEKGLNDMGTDATKGLEEINKNIENIEETKKDLGKKLNRTLGDKGS